MTGAISQTRWVWRAVVAAAALVLASAPAHAQTFSCDLPQGNNKDCTTSVINITMTAINATRLSLTSALALPNNDVKAADYGAGFKAAGTVTLVAKSNAAANITMASSTSPSTYSGVEWSTDGTTFTSPATLFSTGGATAGLSKVITFRTKLQWAADAPGNYTQTLNFTIASP
jgi:hypothetical protein